MGAFLDFLDNLADSIDDVFEGVVDKSKNRFEEFSDSVKLLPDFAKDMRETIRDDLKEIRNETKNSIIELIPTLEKPIEKLDRTKQTIENFIDANDLIKILAREFNLRDKNIKKGDHLIVQRYGYTHHAIALNDTRVIHYVFGIVTTGSMEEFAGMSTVNIKEDSPKLYDREEIINRAFSRISESEYNVAFNNCEHFCNWCRSGHKYLNRI